MKRLTAVVLSLFMLCSCGPSYPKDKVAESLVGLCKKEYGVDVMAGVAGTTIGVFVEIPGLIAELMKQVSSGPMDPPPPLLMEGVYQHRRFDFQFLSRGSFVRVDKDADLRKEDKPPRRDKKAASLETLDHVSLCLNRVALSTDARLEFYILVARDPLAHLDIVYSGHLGDLKQVQYWVISQGELQRRSRVSLRHPPEEVAHQTVREFIEDLSQETILQLLSRYADHSTRFGELSPKILQLTVDLQGRQEALFSVEWPSRQIQRDKVIVYVPLSPVNYPGALLFTVQIREGRGYLANIERFETEALSDEYALLGSPENWKNLFFLEPINLTGFLSEQITKRVLSEFRPLNEQESAEKKAKSPQPATDRDVARVLMETSAYVLNSYEFRDFDRLNVTDAMDGSRWSVSSKELPLYRNSNAPELKNLP